MNTRFTSSKKIGAMLATLGIAAILAPSAYAYVPLTGQVQLGSRNANVTNLQEFLASMPDVYPEGLVTGYFGNLTYRAVLRFQAKYGIAQVGRVGPQTMAKINSLMLGGVVTTDMTGPMIYNVSRTPSTSSATFTFNTNEATNARIVFNTSPVMFNEGDINSNGFQAIGGYAVNSGASLSTSHVITLPNLSANTRYYYTIVATDAAGNVSVYGPNNTLQTNP